MVQGRLAGTQALALRVLEIAAIAAHARSERLHSSRAAGRGPRRRPTRIPGPCCAPLAPHLVPGLSPREVGRALDREMGIETNQEAPQMRGAELGPPTSSPPPAARRQTPPAQSTLAGGLTWLLTTHRSDTARNHWSSAITVLCVRTRRRHPGRHRVAQGPRRGCAGQPSPVPSAPSLLLARAGETQAREMPRPMRRHGRARGAPPPWARTRGAATLGGTGAHGVALVSPALSLPRLPCSWPGQGKRRQAKCHAQCGAMGAQAGRRHIQMAPTRARVLCRQASRVVAPHVQTGWISTTGQP